MFEEGPFIVPPVHAKVGVRIKSLPSDPKLNILQEINNLFLFCSLYSVLFYFGEKLHH